MKKIFIYTLVLLLSCKNKPVEKQKTPIQDTFPNTLTDDESNPNKVPEGYKNESSQQESTHSGNTQKPITNDGIRPNDNKYNEGQIEQQDVSNISSAPELKSETGKNNSSEPPVQQGGNSSTGDQNNYDGNAVSTGNDKEINNGSNRNENGNSVNNNPAIPANTPSGTPEKDNSEIINPNQSDKGGSAPGGKPSNTTGNYSGTKDGLSDTADETPNPNGNKDFGPTKSPPSRSPGNYPDTKSVLNDTAQEATHSRNNKGSGSVKSSETKLSENYSGTKNELTDTAQESTHPQKVKKAIAPTSGYNTKMNYPDQKRNLNDTATGNRLNRSREPNNKMQMRSKTTQAGAVIINKRGLPLLTEESKKANINDTGRVNKKIRFKN